MTFQSILDLSKDYFIIRTAVDGNQWFKSWAFNFEHQECYSHCLYMVVLPTWQYRMRFNATPGFYFSNSVFGWGSIKFDTHGVLLFKLSWTKLFSVKNMGAASEFQALALANPGKTKESLNVISIWLQIIPGTAHFMVWIILRMSNLTRVGLYLSWGSIFSKSVFDRVF